MGKRKQLVAPAAPPKAEGKGKKRTPQSEFDPAAGKDIYEPDKIIAQRMVKGGVTQYQVKWVGYDSKANTWEPLENLAGCEDMIADFKEREKQRLAERCTLFTEKRAQGHKGRAQGSGRESEAGC